MAYISREEMAIIKNVGLGCRGEKYPMLWFTVCVVDGGAALQIFSMKDAEKIIADAGVYDIKDLEGMPCSVINDDNIIRFVKVLKL